METKITIKTVGYALCATLLVGMLIGSALTWKCGKQREVNVYVPDPLIALQLDGILQQQIKLRKDLQDKWKTWTFVTAEGETVKVDSTTKWKDVPVIQTNFDNAFTIKVDDSPLTIDVFGYVITKGKPDSLVIRPRKTTYHTQIKVKQPWVDPYALAAFYVNYDLRPMAEVELGLTFWRKAVVFGRLTAGDSLIQVKPFVGVKWILF